MPSYVRTTRLRTLRVRTLLIVIVLLLLPLIVAHVSVAQKRLETEALNQVAERENIPVSRLSLLEMQEEHLPLTGRRLYQAKITDQNSGEIYGATIDQAGETVDLRQAQQQERVAFQEQYGALQPELYQKLQSMADEEALTVAIWLKASDLSVPPRPDLGHEMETAEAGDALSPSGDPRATDSSDLQEKADGDQPARPLTATDPDRDEKRAIVDAAEASNRQELAQQVAALQAPLLDDLAEQGVQPLYTSATAPLLYVELPKSAILEMARRSDVDTIYPPYTNFDAMEVAKPTQKADDVDGWGYEGTGVSVAILEDSRIEFDNPYLDLGGSSESDTVRVPSDSNVDQHATATGGMVASQHGTQEGIAHGVDLYSANATTYGDSDLSDAMDWAVGKNMDIINNSWGGNTGNTNLNVHDRHLDYIVRYNADSVLVAAGNEANTCGSQTDRVTSPARAYNVISVGGYNDADTTTWDDDGVYVCSSFVDPSTGVQKPEVAASGQSIVSTTDNSSDWIANVGSGTSYATPMVSGEAALLLEGDTSLSAYPESVKAIIMATALHNIEGDTRLSDIDGAGGVDMRAAFHLADEGWWEWDSVQESDFPYTYTQYAHTGETVRAVIAWNSNPTSDYSSDPLEADIDLRVYDPNGSYVTGSASFNNSYEIVEFEAPQTGSYDFRISEFRFDGTSEYVGFAFWPGYRGLAPYDPDTYDTPPVSRDYYRINAASQWNAAGIRMPSSHDYDIYLYDEGAFGDPDDHTWLEDSTLGGDSLDFVVIDGNHAPLKDYFLETDAYTGSGGTYDLEWATHSTTANDGTYGPYTMTPSQLLRVWDAPFNSGQEKRILVRPINGNIDLGLALFDTDSDNSSTYYQGRSQAVAAVDSNGLDADELLTYTATNSDEYGLVVWSNDATLSSDFMLYVDSTAPTGAIHIEGALPYVNTTSVSVGINVSDGDTTVTDMRFSNDGSSWSSWEPFSGSKSWTLISGEGQKTVYAEFRNTVGFTTTISDTITVDMTPPSASASSPNSAPSPSFTVNWSGNDAVAGVDTYDVQYRVGSSGTWTDWMTGTTDTTAVFGPNNPVTVQHEETYYFRVRARDFAGNVSTYASGDGDTSTYVESAYIYLPLTIGQ